MKKNIFIYGLAWNIHEVHKQDTNATVRRMSHLPLSQLQNFDFDVFNLFLCRFFLFFFLSLEGEYYCLYITIVFPPLEDCIIRKEYFGMSCWEGPDGAPTPYSISCEGKLKHCNTVQTHSVLGHEWQLICGACAGVQRVIFQKDWMSNIWLYSQPQNFVALNLPIKTWIEDSAFWISRVCSLLWFIQWRERPRTPKNRLLMQAQVILWACCLGNY